MHARELILEPIVHIAPARALEGLAADQAHRRAGAGIHSIAEVVAHMAFWQDWFIDRCRGVQAPMVEHAAEGWPAVPDGTWPDLARRFARGLEDAAALGEPASRMDAPVTPAIEFPPLAHYTIRDALTHLAHHNAHHLGQVILLRQLLGAWPPPAGSYTW